MKISGYWDEMDPTSEFGIIINSCGHNFLSQNMEINRPHGRNDYLLLYVSKEYEWFELETLVKAPVGSLILYKPFEKQRHYYDGYHIAENYYIHFTLDGSDILEQIPLKSSFIYTLTPNRKLEIYFENIMEELQSHKPYYKKICVSQFIELLSHCYRKIHANEYSGKPLHLNLVANVIRQMNKDYYMNKTLDDYANENHFSKYYLIHVFKEAVGCTPIVYRNKIRMKHAQELLEDGSEPVKNIAEMVGYENPAYFCDAFRAMTGLSPSSYRKKYRG